MVFTTEAGNKNVDVLINELKLKRLSNSSIVFENSFLFVLSPSVQNPQEKFDINLVNIDNAKKSSKKGLLIIRYFDYILIGDLKSFIKDMTLEENLYSDSRTQKWLFRVKKEDNNFCIIISKDKKKRFKLIKIEKDDLKVFVNMLLSSNS